MTATEYKPRHAKPPVYEIGDEVRILVPVYSWCSSDTTAVVSSESYAGYVGVVPRPHTRAWLFTEQEIEHV